MYIIISNDFQYSYFPGFTSWTFGNEFLGVPAIEVSLSGALDMYDRLDKGELTFVSMKKSDDVNKWYDSFKNGGMIWYSVSLSIITLINVILSAWRLQNYIAKVGVTFSLAQTILGLILISNIVKLIVVSVDPIYSRHIFGYLASTILNTITFPISLLTTLLITFYWHEIITMSSSKVYVNIRRKMFVIPAIIFTVSIFILEVASSVVRGLQFTVMKLANASTGLFIALLAIINIYCFVIGYSVIKRLNRSSGVKNESKKTKLTNVTKGVMLGAASTMLTIPFLSIIFYFMKTFARPDIFILVFYFCYFFLSVGDTFKILAFGFPTTNITSTKDKTNSKSSISSKKSDISN